LAPQRDIQAGGEPGEIVREPLLRPQDWAIPSALGGARPIGRRAPPGVEVRDLTGESESLRPRRHRTD